MSETLVLLPSVLLGSPSLAPLGASLRRRGLSVTEVDLSGAITPGEVASRYSAGVGNEPVTWVAHSNAGFYLPQILTDRPDDVGVFVDASLPEEGASTVSASGSRLETVRSLAGRDGVLPAWPDWWGEEQLTELLPDIEHRRLLHECSPRLPLEYFTAEIDVPAQWRQVRAGYVCFDGAYEEVVADRVVTFGWPVRHVPGGHLTVLTDPDEVADAVLELADGLCS